MAGQKTISTTYNPVTPTAPPDYVVTGDPVPDCKGNYFENGTYGAYPKYTRQDNAYEIWQTSPTQFVISTAAGNPGVHSWMKPTGTILGDYPHWLSSSGTAIVSAGA